MTIEAWVRPVAFADWTTILIKERSGGLSYSLFGSDGANRPPAAYLDISGLRSIVGTARLPLSAWSHVAVTYDGAMLRLYVNGAQVSAVAQTGSAAASTSPLYIGANSIAGHFFNGLIDEIRLYNRALSAAEIVTDMNTPITR